MPAVSAPTWPSAGCGRRQGSVGSYRLFESGSDRQGMRWLGEHKSLVEGELFAAHRDLFSQVRLVFFDTTSVRFEGSGGQTLGRYAHSKDHRPDRLQVVLGALLTETGRPVSLEVAPGNRSDAEALLPMVDQARKSFGPSQVCWVADQRMISRSLIEGLEARRMTYILGARLRRVREVRGDVLGRGGRYRKVAPNLEVKEVWTQDQRYIICHNPEEAAKDAADRQARVELLREKLAEEARYDGKFVLRTNTSLPADEVARQHKQLILVEQLFRTAKSLLESRAVYRKWDAAITGHLFISFLALLLRHELAQRLEARGHRLEWADIKRPRARRTLGPAGLAPIGDAEKVQGEITGDIAWPVVPFRTQLGPRV